MGSQPNPPHARPLRASPPVHSWGAAWRVAVAGAFGQAAQDRMRHMGGAELKKTAAGAELRCMLFVCDKGIVYKDIYDNY